ncbi:putative TPR repeat protein [Rosellinia necatrix]|uniref:Succinate dehydrogenase assembly factor 2, mitochondrial n=1 Tax=Rosellinia necatrix TaxID=77044 RepID=A0A1S7UMI7_ROSNE|nr:putative TPR repeat protein [Rosellinia necatrix]
MASLLPRTLLRPARHALARPSYASPSKARVPRVPGVSMHRGMATVGNAPPMEPHKQRPREMAVGELEGAVFTIEPLRRVGEDEKTMRARLVYQSRKRGILETDLLLSTFADEYLPTMTREQMVEYDLFLDENDWDIYYWATQEEPSPSTSSASSSSSTDKTATPTPQDTNSAAYGSSTETATAESTTATAAATSTGGHPLTGEHVDAKAYAADPASSPSPPSPSPSPFAGEWAQTVGTFKPAYRPVPARWRDSAILGSVRDHVRARAGEKGGMAFMPALKSE